ncbi:hypothetical protein JCM11641_004915 [Rhodosporidiobolus odoratus]
MRASPIALLPFVVLTLIPGALSSTHAVGSTFSLAAASTVDHSSPIHNDLAVGSDAGRLIKNSGTRRRSNRLSSSTYLETARLTGNSTQSTQTVKKGKAAARAVPTAKRDVRERMAVVGRKQVEKQAVETVNSAQAPVNPSLDYTTLFAFFLLKALYVDIRPAYIVPAAILLVVGIISASLKSATSRAAFVVPTPEPKAQVIAPRIIISPPGHKHIPTICGPSSLPSLSFNMPAFDRDVDFSRSTFGFPQNFQ